MVIMNKILVKQILVMLGVETFESAQDNLPLKTNMYKLVNQTG